MFCFLDADSTAISTATAVPGPSPSETGTSGSSTPTGAIAGGVVGGLVGIVLIIAVGWYCITRRKRRNQAYQPRPLLERVQRVLDELCGHGENAVWAAAVKG